MKICVYGLWHLGTVTAACTANAGLTTIGLDEDELTVSRLKEGIPPLFEPGLAELVKSGLASGRLSFTHEVRSAISASDLIWITFDTPVDEEDQADALFVMNKVESIFPYVRDGGAILISSQLPVGSLRMLEHKCETLHNGKQISFAYSPENLRLGDAIRCFMQPDRIIVGVRNEKTKQFLSGLFNLFSEKVIWVSPESAEMTKHALNSYLATCITFINEIATLCERVGAEATDVEFALRSDPRVGHKAYIKPGTAFGGGTLARDVNFLTKVARQQNLSIPLLESIIPSNQLHRLWAIRRLREELGNLEGKKLAIMGLSYKPGTNAVRRSVAVDLCRELASARARVVAYDPQVKIVPDDLVQSVALVQSYKEALENSDGLIIATEWPEFKNLSVDEVVNLMRNALVIDQNRFLDSSFESNPKIKYVTIGKPS